MNGASSATPTVAASTKRDGLPTIDEAVEVLRGLMSQPDHVTHDGRNFVRGQRFKDAVIPHGDPLWTMPKNMPHGHHYSPAYKFFEDVRFSGKVERIRSGGEYYRASEPK